MSLHQQSEKPGGRDGLEARWECDGDQGPASGFSLCWFSWHGLDDRHSSCVEFWVTVFVCDTPVEVFKTSKTLDVVMNMDGADVCPSDWLW